MKRRLDRLLDGPFDLLVVGGGIYGSWVALDAACRGLRVALIEQEDWGAGTSSASSKLIHGGIRYLEQRAFGLVRKSLDERSRLHRIAPHRIRPLRFALPVWAGARVGRFKLKAGLWLYDRFSGEDETFAGHESLSRAEMLARYPFLDGGALKAGFTYADAQTDDARFVLEVVAAAVHYGVAAVNHVRALHWLHDGRRVAGARVVDRETGATMDLRARVTINCSGPWVGRVRREGETAPAPKATLPRLSKGVHLLMPALPTGDAIVSPTPDGRVIFLIPWYGRTLLGTTDTDYGGSPGHSRATVQDVGYLLNQANRCLGAGTWEEADAVGRFSGLRALVRSEDASPHTISREWLLEEQDDGLLVSVGGKFTSARADAAEAVDRIFRCLERDSVPCSTAERMLPWAPDDSWEIFRGRTISDGIGLGLDEETAAMTVRRFGTQVIELHRRLAAHPELARRIVPEAPFCLAEVQVAVDSEMARTLQDVLRRRIPLLLMSTPGEEVVTEVARLVAEMLPWDDERIRAEIDSIVRPHTRISDVEPTLP